MKEPKRIPLDPSTPKAIRVSDDKIKPLKQLYLFTENFIADSDSRFIKINNENSNESTET